METNNLANPAVTTPASPMELDWVHVYAKSSYTLPSGCSHL